MDEKLKSPIQPFDEFKVGMSARMDSLIEPYLKEMPSMGNPDFDKMAREIFKGGFHAGFLELSKKVTHAITGEEI